MSLRSIDPAALLLLHQETLAGSVDDFDPCDEMLLDAALAYPTNQAILRAGDVADIAAAYAVGILKFRPFAVGNERAALLAMGLFLYLNDWRLNAPQEEAASVMWRISSAEMGESALADWIRSNL
jgi:death on curing protein